MKVRKSLVLSLLGGGAAAVLIALGVRAALETVSSTLIITWFSRPIELLEPVWLYLIAVIPFFFATRVISLTDLSLLQQVVQATVRSLIVVGAAIALSRPAWTTSDNKIATVVLVDVSESVSDRQL